MTCFEFLKLNLKVLKAFGYHWSGENLTVFNIVYSFTAISVYSILLAAVCFHAGDNVVFVNVNSMVMNAIDFITIVLFWLVLMTHMMLAMFYRKWQRVRFFESLQNVNDIISQYNPGHDFKGRRKMRRHYYAFFASEFTILLFYLISDYENVYLLALDVTFLIGSFAIILNQWFFVFIIYIIKTKVSVVSDMIAEHQITLVQGIALKLKLSKLIQLFNKSFGIVILIDVFAILLHFTGIFYVIAGNLFEALGAYNISFVLRVAFETIPTLVVSIQLFCVSEDLKNKVNTSIS